MIFRLTCELQGRHFHCYVTSSPAVDQTFATLGQIVMDERDFTALAKTLTPTKVESYPGGSVYRFELDSKEVGRRLADAHELNATLRKTIRIRDERIAELEQYGAEKEWLCETCRRVWPKSALQSGVKVVFCPDCGTATCDPKDSVLLREANKRIAELEEQVRHAAAEERRAIVEMLQTANLPANEDLRAGVRFAEVLIQRRAQGGQQQ